MLYERRRRRELVAGKVGEESGSYGGGYFGPYQRSFSSRTGGAGAPYSSVLPSNSSSGWFGSNQRSNPTQVAPFNIVSPSAGSSSQNMMLDRGVEDAAQAVSKDLARAFLVPNTSSKLCGENADPLPSPTPASHRSRPPLFFHSNPSSSGMPSLDNQGNGFRRPSFSLLDARSEPLYPGAQSSAINSTSGRNTNIGSRSTSVNPSSGYEKSLLHSSVTNTETFNIFHSSGPSLSEEKFRHREEEKKRAESLRMENLRAMEDRRLAKEREEQERKEKEWKEEQKAFRERQTLAAKELEEIKREQAARQPGDASFSNIYAPPKLQTSDGTLPSFAATALRSSDDVSAKKLSSVGNLKEEPLSGHLWLSQPPSKPSGLSDLPLMNLEESRKSLDTVLLKTSKETPESARKSSVGSPLPFAAVRPARALLEPIDLKLPKRSVSMPGPVKPSKKPFSMDIKALLDLTHTAPPPPQQVPSSFSQPFFVPRQSADTSEVKGGTYLSEGNRLPGGTKGLSSLLSFRRTRFSLPFSQNSSSDEAPPSNSSAAQTTSLSHGFSATSPIHTPPAVAAPLDTSVPITASLLTPPSPSFRLPEALASSLSPLPLPHMPVKAASPTPNSPPAAAPFTFSAVSPPPSVLTTSPAPVVLPSLPAVTPAGNHAGVFESFPKTLPIPELLSNSLLTDFPSWEKKKEKVLQEEIQGGTEHTFSLQGKFQTGSDELSIGLSKFVGN